MAYQDKLKPIGPASTSSYSSKLKPIAPKAPVQADHGFLGNIAADIIKTPARFATNAINAGQQAFGKKPTQPFSGEFLGEVKPVGQEGNFGDKLKDTFGASASLASNIPIVKGGKIGFDVLKGVAKEGGLKTFYKAAAPLAKEGFAAGALSGGGGSLQEGDSAAQAATDAIISGAAGGVIAPVLGAGGALFGKGMNKFTDTSKIFKGESKFAKEAAKKDLDKVAEYTRPVLDASEKAKLKSEFRPTESGGLFGLGDKKFQLGEQDRLRAQAVKDIIDPKMSKADENIDLIHKNIDQEYKNEMIPFLRENPVPYDPMDLNRYLDNKMVPPTFLKNNPENFANFKDLKSKALSVLKQFPNNQEGVQQARTAIDRMITEEFGPLIWDKTMAQSSPMRQAVLKLRTALNDFTHDSIRVRDINTLNKVEDFLKVAQKRGIKIDDVEAVKEEILREFGTEILPENELKAIIFRNKLKNMNLKFEAAENIWDNSAKEVGKSKFQNLTKDPTVRTAAGIGVGYGLSQIFGRGTAGNNTN